MLFGNVVTSEADRCVVILVVSHIIPDKIRFFEYLCARYGRVVAFGKSSSFDESVALQLEDLGVRVKSVCRATFRDDLMRELAEVGSNQNLVCVDVGGYFCRYLDDIKRGLGDRFLGVVEDTENGHQKYLQLNYCPVPVISVARSDLKSPEDHLVGESIVFSVDAILRENSMLLSRQRALVLGYGKIGQAIARSLKGRGVVTDVYDVNPIQRVLAQSHGYQIPDRKQGLAQATIIFCATGNASLDAIDLDELSMNTLIASATSRDDEFGTLLNEMLDQAKIANGFTTLCQNNYEVHFLHAGAAVNFAHKAVVGPYIELVQAEITGCIQTLQSGPQPNGLTELSKCQREGIARAFISEYQNSFS